MTCALLVLAHSRASRCPHGRCILYGLDSRATIALSIANGTEKKGSGVCDWGVGDPATSGRIRLSAGGSFFGDASRSKRVIRVAASIGGDRNGTLCIAVSSGAVRGGLLLSPARWCRLSGTAGDVPNVGAGRRCVAVASFACAVVLDA